MADIEKVIKGLEACTGSVGDCNEHCPYFENCDDYEDGCRIEMERNALELLKYQHEHIETFLKDRLYMG